MKGRRRLGLALAALCIGGAGAFSIWIVDMRSDQRAYFLDRKGELVHAALTHSDTTSTVVIDETLRLTSSTGLRVDLRVRRPAPAAARSVPVLLVLGGHRTGKDAVALADAPVGVAYVAIDYPYEGSHRIRGLRETVAAMPAIQRAFLDTPPALSLALDWLLAQSWADPHRIEMVGVSLGVPFATTAGALDERFCRVWLIHGAGDNHAWLEHNLEAAFPVAWQRAVMNEIFYTLIYAEAFRTSDWVEAIPPRPVVIIAAHEDERLPAEALAPLPEIAAREADIELLWTDGLHIEPDRPEVIRQLLEMVLERVRGPAGSGQNRQTNPSDGNSGR